MDIIEHHVIPFNVMISFITLLLICFDCTQYPVASQHNHKYSNKNITVSTELSEI